MTKLFKKTLVSVLFFIFSVLSFYFLNFLLFKEGDILICFISFLVFLLLFSSCFVFFLFTFKKSPWRFLVYFLISLLFLLIFGFNIYTGAGVIFFFLLLINTDLSFQNENAALLKFKFSRLAKIGIRGFFTALAVLISILLFLSPKIVGGQLNIPRSLFDIISPAIERVLFQWMPSFSNEMTVDEYLLSRASETLKQFKIQTQPQAISLFPIGGEKIEIDEPDEKEAQEEFLLKGRTQFSEMVGRQVKGNEKIQDIFYELVSGQISRTIKPYQQAGTAGLIFIFFLMTRMALIIFSYFCSPITWLIFILFKKKKFFEIKTKKLDKETIVI